MKLTAKTIRALHLCAGKRDQIEFDDDVPGFGLRLREGGSRTWIFQYKVGTKQRRLVLGKGTELTAGKARDIARDLHAKVRLGGDPAGEKAEPRVRAVGNLRELRAELPGLPPLRSTLAAVHPPRDRASPVDESPPAAWAAN